MTWRGFALSSVFLLLSSFLGCGKKGPPLAPLNMAPEAPQSVAARRLGDTVFVQFTVPAKSAAGTGPFSVDHLDVYAVTIAPGAATPPNRDLLKPQFAVAKIPVRRPPDPEAPPAEGDETDKRPKPGDIIAFVEKLTPAALTPQASKPVVESSGAKKPAPPSVVSPAAAAAPAVAAPAAPSVLSRIYLVQGVARNGTRGPASVRANVPLLDAPGPARPATTSYDASSVTITWQPPASRSDEAPGVTYNVYAAPAADSGAAGAPASAPAPLNAAPLTETTFKHEGATAGKEQCFIVRSVATVGAAAIESDPSDPICVTPLDTFPPAAPKGLAAVAGTGVVNLIWDANTDADLGGYVVLRGEAPGDTLQRLTPDPIRETRYVDRTVSAGVTYVYAVVAVDRATPPNQSALSNKVQEIAR